MTAAKVGTPAELRRQMVITPVEMLSVLNRLRFFESFTAAEKELVVADDAHFRVYQPEERLICQGSTDQSLFIVLTGTVSVTEGSGDTLLAVLGAGDIFGEMAFLTDTRRTANVIARESVIALKLDRVLFERLAPEIREKFKDKIIEKVVARLDAANKELARHGWSAASGVPESAPSMGASMTLSRSDASVPVFARGRELIRKIISGAARLPVLPGVMVNVQQAIQLPGTSPAQLARIIETDSDMAAGILKLANSDYYGFRGKVSTVRHAAALFGVRRLAELIGAMSAGPVLVRALDGYGITAGDLWRHSIRVACAAGEIAAAMGADLADSAFLAGLLHDVGKIILDPYVMQRKILFDHYHARHRDRPVQDAERDILGFDHAAIAAILCDHWSLSRAISFGIRFHHQPATAGDHALSHIVHVADHLTYQSGLGPAPSPALREMDPASRSAVGLDPGTLTAALEKADHYAASLSKHLLRH